MVHVVVACLSGLDSVRSLKTHFATTADATNSPVNNRPFPSTLLQTRCLHSFSMTSEIKATMPAPLVVYKVLHSGPNPPTHTYTNVLKAKKTSSQSEKRVSFTVEVTVYDRCVYAKLCKAKLFTFKFGLFALWSERFWAGDSICWSGFLHREQVRMLMRAAVGQDSSPLPT